MARVIKAKVVPKARPKEEQLTLEQKLEKALNPDNYATDWAVVRGEAMVFLNNVGRSAAGGTFKPGDVARAGEGQDGDADPDTTLKIEDDRIEDGGRGNFYRMVMVPLANAPELESLLKELGRPVAPVLPPPPPPIPPPEEVVDRGISYASGGSMVWILNHFGSCDPPIRFASGYPLGTHAAQVWMDVLLDRPNPKGQEVQEYWIGTMVRNIYGYEGMEALIKEMKPELREYRRKHGTNNPIIRAEILRIMPWSRMEAKLIEDKVWKPSEAELKTPYNAAPTVAKEQYMPTNNQTMILNAIFNFLQSAARKHGLDEMPQQEGFLENLEAMEGFVKQYGAKVGVTFEEQGTVDARLTFLEDICITRAGDVGVPYLKPRTLASAANPVPVAGVEANDELFRMLVTRVATLESVLQKLAFTLNEAGFGEEG